MLTICYEILKSSKPLLEFCRNQFKYIQVDEAQDTSKIQHQIIKLLTSPSNNLFMVADDDQSIYAFRGAFPQALLSFEKDYPGAKVYYMEQNYRSTKNIIGVANTFIKNNKDRYDKNIFTQNTDGKTIDILEVANEKEQVNHLINTIKKSEKMSDIAILYRNNFSSVYVMHKLNQQGLLFYCKDFKNLFFTHWVTQDIIAFLKLALDKTNFSCFEKVYFKLNTYLSKEVVADAKRKISRNPESVFAAIKRNASLASYQAARIGKIELVFDSIANESPVRAIEAIEYVLEYREYLEKKARKSSNSLDILSDMLSILKLIAEDTRTIADFLNRISELEFLIKNARYNKKRNAVVLSTLHSSKGLEFKKVFMVDLIDGLFPSADSVKQSKLGDSKMFEEERRLFYVGMTRAISELTLLTPVRKSGSRMDVSRFVTEVRQVINPSTQDTDKKTDYCTDSFFDFFEVGNMVSHKRFGFGEVKSINGDVITVDFKEEGKKDMSLTLCMENNILALVQNM